MDFHIIYRTCSRVNTFSGPPRFIEVPKSEIIRRCFNSLALSAKKHIEERNDPFFSLKLTVLDDNSDQSTIDNLVNVSRNVGFDEVEFIYMQDIGRTGNGQSIKTMFEIARNLSEANSYIYFCEDDYLHNPISISETLDSIRYLTRKYPYELGDEFALHLCDYPDRYISSKLLPANIFLSLSRYWRTIQHTTGSFIIHKESLLRYWDDFIAFSNYGIVPGVSEDNTINKVWRKIPCLSPMPTLSIHLQYQQTLSPFTDWRSIWDASA